MNTVMTLAPPSAMFAIPTGVWMAVLVVALVLLIIRRNARHAKIKPTK